MNQINNFREELDLFKSVGLQKQTDSDLILSEELKNASGKSNILKAKPKGNNQQLTSEATTNNQTPMN